MRLRLKLGRLQELLAASSISQNHWALKVGISRGHWSEIVNGRHPYPSARTRVRMLDALGVPLGELFAVETGVAPADDIDFRRAIAERFIIDSELGQGGMGAVYLGRDVRHGRTVAIKVISPETVSGIGLDQFQREISTVAKLHHPCILPLYDSGEAAGHPYFVMPLVRGGSLRGRLTERVRLSAADVAHVAGGIAAALHHAHTEHVLHCDVKPENVLLFDDHPYVMDFGIARKLHSEIGEWSLRDQLDLSAGTPAYVSPEQASGDPNLDARSDVYSLGCMVFEMLTGRPPFEGTSTQAIVSRRFIVPPPIVRDYAPDVPARVQSVLERAMSLPREQRHESASVFASELRDAALSGSRVFAGAALAVSRSVGRVRRMLHLRAAHPVGAALFDVVRDAKHALRSLRRAPGFAAVVVLTLGLAMGANATMFGMVDRLVLSPPAHIAEPDRVVKLKVARFFDGRLTGRATSMSYAAFTDFRDGATTLSEVAAIDDIDLSYGVGRDARSLRAAAASGQFFPLTRATPALGVFFGESHDAGPGERVAVISHGLWRTSFGERPDVLGESMLLNGSPFVVIGVAPRGFTGTSLRPIDVWVPLSTQVDTATRMNRGWQFVEIFARLKDGVTGEAANADVERAYHVGHADMREYEAKAVASVGHLIPARDAEGRGGAPQVATWLFGMAVVVLLIACANIANLMLARGITRRGEFAVRRALGVSGGRLARALLTESVVLTLLGSVAALVIARWGGAFARNTLLPGVNWEGSALNGRVLALTLACTIFAALAAGLLPLWSASRTDIGQALRGSARGLTARARRTLSTLLVVQTTLATATLIGAGLFVASLDRVKNLDLGFEPSQLLRARVRLAADMSAPEVSSIYRRAIERLNTANGVVRAGGVMGAPFMGNYATSVRVPGRDSIPRQPGGGPYFFRLTPGAFEALGFRVIRGRAFTDSDARAGGGPAATIVTQRFAQTAWPGDDAIGKCLILDDDGPCIPVVGVIADLHRQAILEDPFLAFFMPIAAGDTTNVPDALVVRVRGDAARAVEVIRGEFHAVAPGLPFVAVEPYEELINPQARSWRLGATMFTTFGLLSLLIAAVGVHGMLSYLVNARTRELGVRAALGATPGSMLRMVVAGGFALAVTGVAIGSAIALAAGTRIESLLFETSAREPVVFAAAAAVIVGVTLIATVVPGMRAARADPLRALRAE